MLGKGRAGGTLLNNVLAQLDGFVAPGELPRLWTWGLSEGWSCGCGVPVPECGFWRQVVTGTFARAGSQPPVDEVVAWQEHVLRWTYAPRMLTLRRSSNHLPEPLRSYVELLSALYKSLAELASARVIVESTRWATAPTPLGLVPDVDVYLLHLVRDPRGVVYSWKRRKPLTDRPGSPEMQRFGAFYTTTSWWARSALAEVVTRRRLARSMVLRYEDFIADPKATISSILRFTEEPQQDVVFLNDATIELDATHTVGGNPNRLERGSVVLRRDDKWIEAQPWRDRLIGTALAMPFLQLYGYPVKVRRGPKAD